MIIISMPFPPYNFKMAANESVILRSIRDVVGEVLRDLQASVTERAFFCSILSTGVDSLSTTVDLDQIHFLLLEARECLRAHSESFGVKWGWQACTTLTSCFERVFYI